MPNGRKFWASRVLAAERRIAEGLLAYRNRRSAKIAQRRAAFQHTVLVAILDILRDDADEVYVGGVHPMVVLSRIVNSSHLDKCYIDETQTRAGGFLFADLPQVKTFAHGAKPAMITVSGDIATFPRGEFPESFQAGLKALLDAPAPPEVGVRLHLYRNEYTLGQYFQPWLHGDCSATVNALFRGRAFADLPNDIKKLIIARVRDRSFDKRMRKMDILNA